MNDKQKTKAQLIQELQDTQARAAELDTRVQHLEKLLNEQASPLPAHNKQSEQEITNAEPETSLRTFSNIVEQASESIIVTNLDGRITYINPATERIFGYRLDEVIGKEPIIFNAEPDPASSHREIVETVQRGEQFTQEVLHRRKDGSVFWASINISPMRDQNGAIYGYIGLQQDITERKRIEKLVLTERDLSMALNDVTTLAESLKICLDAAIKISEIDSGGIYLINEADGSFDLEVHKGLSEVFVNAVLHYPKSTPAVRMVMAGTPCYFNYEKPDSLPNKNALNEGLKAMAVLPVRYKGQILGCLNIGSHSLGEIPEPSRVALETIASHIGAAVIHARQAEKLLQSRQNYDMLFNTVQDFIVITDGKGDIIHVNEATCNRLGYRKEELLGQPVLMLHPKETHDAAIRRIQAMLLGEEDTCMIPLEAKDGTHIHVETKVWHGKWDGQDAVFGISRDVTARKQFEAALQESKDELASILDNSPIPIGTFDGEKFIYISKAWHEFTGQQQTERPGIDFFVSRLHPDDKEHVLAVWQDSWQKKVSNVAFYRLKDHSGCYRHFAGRITPIFDRSGQFKYFFGYILDVTEGKQAEEKLRESQQRLDLAVNGARIGLWDWCVQAEQIIINEQWAKIIGYSLTELVPVDFKKWAQLCHPDDLKKSNEAVDRHFAGETDYYECEVRLKHKNGEWVWILARGKVFEWDKDGKPTRMTGTHLDITERKQAEFLLIDESVRRRILFEEAKDGIVILDHSRKVFEANKSFANMLGYTTEEMRQLHAWDWEANYPTKEKFLEMWPNMPTSSDTVETCHRRKDGTIYDVEVSWNPMMWSGQLLLYCVCRDITERKLAEDALRESEELYRSTLKASPDSIAIYDLEGRIRIASPSKLKLLGYTRNEEVVGHSIQEFVHPKDHERIRYDIGRVLQGISIGVNEYSALHADGRAFSVESNAEVIRDAAGNPTGIVVITRDITERKRAEAALRESERNYRQIFNATNEAIFLQDVETGRVLDVNDAVLQMFGFDKKEEILGTSVGQFSISVNERPYTREEAFRRIRLAVEEGPQVFEWLTQRKDGERFWVEISLRRTEIGGEGRILAVIRDISERKLAEEALKESEERFRRIFYTSPDAIIISRVEDGLFVDINPSVTRLGGYTREDMIGKTSYEVNIWADSEDRQELVRRLKDVGYCDNYESQFRRKDGSIGLGLVSACVMQLQGVPYIVSITRDITEYKQAQDALKESEERFRRIFYTNPDAIIITRAEDGRFVDINPSVTRITGYTREDAIGKTSIEVNIWVNLKDRQELISRLKETGYYENFELGVRRKDGSIGIGLMSASMIMLEGAPHIVSITRDISEYKRAEDEIRKLSEVVRQSPVSVVITDTGGAISYVNPKFSEVTGYTLEEVKGQNPRILKSGVTPPEEYKILWDTITGGKVWQGRFHNKKKDGGLFWEDATISPIFDKNRQITHFLAIKEDISHNIALEQQLRQAQKMEAIGHLAGGVAHDFNNLLLVIKGFSDLVLRKITPENPNYEHIQQIQRAGDRAAELTRQLLAFSRKQILQPKILDLTALLKDMEKMLRRIIGEDIDLFTIYEDDLYQVKADPGQIEQVILNLAVNARDAMPSGGKLTIESRNAYLDEAYVKANEGSAIGHYAMIAITDTGSGIDKQTQAHIFEPFFTTKDVGKGTGLGLSTVYGIIKQSGGNIWVYSETGIGTTFKIYLPSIDDAGEMPKQHTKSKNAIRGTETILIVEDEDVVCELLKTGLEDLGYKTFNAYSGPKALELIEKHSEEIHMLLTDVVMPEMSGRELADKVEVRYPNIKTLFMSGYTDSEIVHHSVLDEGVAFIQKPFTIPTVAKKIRAMLDEKQPD